MGKGQRDDRGTKNWAETPTTNEKFVEYYQTQGVMPKEEWDEFMNTLRKPLPTTFRINGNGRNASELLEKLETDFFSRFTQGPLLIDGEEIQPPMPLPWYPNKMGWQMDFSRTQLRKDPLLSRLHEFIKHITETGSITRQEAVSMVPPLFLEAQPGDRVLDVCAAPGSKTFQLLEAIHAAPGEPTGLVVANDADAKRCNLLTHQVKRMCSPALIVTHHEGQCFPLLPDLDPKSSETDYHFDRILCDVPCSGDGTLRKQPDIWRRWTSGNGNGLHTIQVNITMRACQLLKVGGRLVYSTCTFNPVEDEAVVAEIIRRTNGAMEVVDVSSLLPELRRLPGLKKWKVQDTKGWYTTWEEAKGTCVKLTQSMFPDEKTAEIQLERCMRFLPHYQDTGGFFVAVFEKTRDINTSSRSAEAAAVDTEGDTAFPHKKPRHQLPKGMPNWADRLISRKGGIDPIKPFANEAIISTIRSFYGFSPDCHIMDGLIARSQEEKPRKVMYVCPESKKVLLMDVRDQLRMISVGLKVFERHPNKDGILKTEYRICQEGLPIVLPHITKQIVRPTVEEFHRILRERSLSLPEEAKIHITETKEETTKEEEEEEGTAVVVEEEEGGRGALPAGELSGDSDVAPLQEDANTSEPVKKQRGKVTDARTIEEIKNTEFGCCILMLRDEEARTLGLQAAVEDGVEGGLAANAPVALTCWRGRGSLTLLCGKHECYTILDRISGAENKRAMCHTEPPVS